MYRPFLVAAPVIKPITLVEVKAQLDISYTAKDDLINAMIAAVTSYLDGWTGILGRALCEQTWRQDFDYFQPCLRLPLFPVISVSSVKYTDMNGAEQTVAGANYSVLTDDLGTYIQFIYNYASPPLKQFLPAAVRVEYVAGYANAGTSPNFTSAVPEDIKQVMRSLIRQWFDNPSAVNVGTVVSSMPFGVKAILGKYSRTRF